MILPEESKLIQFSHNPQTIEGNYQFGDFMRKTSHLLKDSDKKWELVCRATDIQNTEWPSVESYRDRLLDLNAQLSAFISTHQDPFIL